jgi:hypothetical protein
MKKFRFGFLMLLGATVFSVAALGQSSKLTTASIPFAFYAGKSEMPAGTYTLRPADNGRQLLLENADGSAATFLLALPVDTSQGMRPGITFDKVGETYFLRAASNSDQNFHFSKPKLEKELERNGMIAQSTFRTSGL